MRILKRVEVIVCLLLLVSVWSCETDKDRIKKAKEVVTTFLANTSVENSPVLVDLYPDFAKMGKYYKLADGKIVNASINKDGIVNITCKSFVGNILFMLKKTNGEYKIINSKGLSPYFTQNIYKYCKAIGCISMNTFDVDVASICQDKQSEFDDLVYKIKSNIENNFRVQNNNLSINGVGIGYSYLSGEVTVKNYSRFSIPSRCYNIYYDFVDDGDNIEFTKPALSNYKYIQYGESVTESFFETNAQNFSKVKVRLQITSTDFIEQVIADNATGSNCNNNFNSL